jgi:hypothetical protein
MEREILTEDKKRLTLFERNIVVNKNLLKWRNAEKGLAKTEVKENEVFMSGVSSNLRNRSILSTPDIDRDVDASTKWLPLYEIAEGVSFDELSAKGIKDLTRLIAENKLKFVIGGYGSFGNTQTHNRIFTTNEDYIQEGGQNKKTLFEKLFEKCIKFINKKKNQPEIDVLQFFTNVKLSTKNSIETYRDRVGDYLKAIHNSIVSGQTALTEELLRGLITNKYESVLYAEKLYYIITEEQMIEFVKKCEKGLCLDYIKNFSRPLPQKIINKIEYIDNLEIFDNYVILYYDPEEKTYKETAKEKAKRKDPILFGVIAGSNKLYYIDDWIDEYCDLTLEKFIDTINVSKDELKIKQNILSNNIDKNNKNKNKRKRKYKKKKNTDNKDN